MFFKRRKDEEEDKIKLLVITRTESETVIIESLLNAEEIPFMIKHGNLSLKTMSTKLQKKYLLKQKLTMMHILMRIKLVFIRNY